MHKTHEWKAGAAAGLLALTLAAVPASAGFAQPMDRPGAQSFAAADEPIRITLTSRDIAESNQEAAAAYSALRAWWTEELDRIGMPFRAPRIARYRGNTLTACGPVPANNAVYCFNNNTIYFDEVFLAAQTRLAGAALGTDGDMAAVGIIAHEMGHAVAFQLGIRARSSYENESIADCLAGAFARRASEDGSLEEGDVEEAFFAMAAAADPDLSSSGNRRIDSRRADRLARQAHGTREQRQGNFREGLVGGAGACIAELR